jgi:hypothetical protein
LVVLAIVPAMRNDSIEPLSEAAEPRCVPVIYSRESGSLVVIPPGPASGFLLTPYDYDPAAPWSPRSETGQVTDYGRLRAPVYSL